MTLKIGDRIKIIHLDQEDWTLNEDDIFFSFKRFKEIKYVV